jgi:hypothetical protein
LFQVISIYDHVSLNFAPATSYEMQHSADKRYTSGSSLITLARSIFMEHQPPKQGHQSGTPARLEKIGNVWQAFKPGEDSTLSSRVRHLATFFVVESTVVMLASGRTLHLSPELNEFVHQLMVNGVLNLHSLPEEILQDVCSRFRKGQK